MSNVYTSLNPIIINQSITGHERHLRPVPPQLHPRWHLFGTDRVMGQSGAEADACATQPALGRRAHPPGLLHEGGGHAERPQPHLHLDRRQGKCRGVSFRTTFRNLYSTNRETFLGIFDNSIDPDEYLQMCSWSLDMLSQPQETLELQLPLSLPGCYLRPRPRAPGPAR